jgi:hypothetical protein
MTTSGATSGATAGSSSVVNQNYAASDPSTGRWFASPVAPYQAPVEVYLGPWSTGANIMDNLVSLPEEITLGEAKQMYNGGVSARVNRMADGSYQFSTCKILKSLPTKALIGKDGRIVEENGKPILVFDDSKFSRVGYIFLQGGKKSNTIDVIAKAVIETLHMHANGIFLVKKVTTTSTTTTGWGVGMGAVGAALTGSAATGSQAYSAGTGLNHATAGPVYKEGLIVMAVQISDAQVAEMTNPVVASSPAAPVTQQPQSIIPPQVVTTPTVAMPPASPVPATATSPTPVPVPAYTVFPQETKKISQ